MAMPWLKEQSSSTAGKCEPALAKLRAQGCETIGGVGFCWGTYPLMKLAAAGRIQAAVACHPSLSLGLKFFGESVADQVAAAKCPVVFMPAGNDPDIYRDGTLASPECTFADFPDMQHGFVPRGDTSKPEVERDVRRAIDLATTFLTKHL